ncbi:uncharacterized protein M6B38_289675 [Iris pallida]|uniref:Uncharacterized protein n=1 Tax=Iris pallida TaxID=29817 RepID=A0AAX6HWM1_IRIPA|nr:uncharacterized protein M6B38_289675 [Iris pallida]
MPRQYANGGACKIRKRGSSSSSSTASPTVLRNSRFKRAIVAGKRGGSTMRALNWRMNAKSPSAASRMSESSQYNGTQQGPVSARKLANALWELNKIPLQQFAEDLPVRRSRKTPKSLPRVLSDPSHSPESEELSDRLRSSSSHRRRIMPMACQRSRCNEHNYRALNLISNGSLMEIDARPQGHTPRSSVGSKTHLKDLRNCLTTTKELLKLLSRIWRLEDQHPYGISLISALRGELDQARAKVEHLIQEQRFDYREISCLKKRFMEEKSSWKIKEQERIKAAVHSIMEELESEKKLRRRGERLNKSLGVELADTKATLSKVIKELESEKTSREITEQVCKEIVREIGNDKAVVEQLKRESAKVRDELEKEREMLHLADVWREERVQMKLLEAKAQFEEKNAAVDHLRNELEAFLETKRTKEDALLKERVDVGNGGEEDERRDSVESDLRSIELNMESDSRGYSWSYATKVTEADANMIAPVEEGDECRRTCQQLSGDVGHGPLSESRSHHEERAEELNQDAERYVSVKELRDHMLAGTGTRDLANLTRQWNRKEALPEMDDQVCEGLNIAEIVKSVREGYPEVKFVVNSSDSVQM